MLPLYGEGTRLQFTALIGGKLTSMIGQKAVVFSPFPQLYG